MNYNKKSIFLRHRKTLLNSAYTLNMDILRHPIAHIYKLWCILKNDIVDEHESHQSFLLTNRDSNFRQQTI